MVLSGELDDDIRRRRSGLSGPIDDNQLTQRGKGRSRVCLGGVMTTSSSGHPPPVGEGGARDPENRCPKI